MIKILLKFFRKYIHWQFAYIFDKTHNVNTMGRIEIADFNYQHKNIKHAKACQATPIIVLNKIFAYLKQQKINNKKYIFFDIGCGQGRGLIYAFKFGFLKCYGIDLIPAVANMAKKNIQTLEKLYPSTNQIQIECADVLNINFGHIPFPTIFFLFNPFDSHILSQFLDHLGQEREKFFFQDIIIYINPIRHYIFQLKGYELIHKINAINSNDVVNFYKRTSLEHLYHR